MMILYKGITITLSALLISSLYMFMCCVLFSNDTVCMCYIIQLIKLYLINNVHICIGVVCVYDKFVLVTPTMFQFFDKKCGCCVLHSWTYKFDVTALQYKVHASNVATCCNVMNLNVGDIHK